MIVSAFAVVSQEIVGGVKLPMYPPKCVMSLRASGPVELIGASANTARLSARLNALARITVHTSVNNTLQDLCKLHLQGPSFGELAIWMTGHVTTRCGIRKLSPDGPHVPGARF